MAGQSQLCPICSAVVIRSERYSKYVCADCCRRASDEDGRLLVFSNLSISGGFAAHYRDTHEVRSSHVCYIDGIECWADEAHIGGIVIQPREETGAK